MIEVIFPKESLDEREQKFWQDVQDVQDLLDIIQPPSRLKRYAAGRFLLRCKGWLCKQLAYILKYRPLTKVFKIQVVSEPRIIPGTFDYKYEVRILSMVICLFGIPVCKRQLKSNKKALQAMCNSTNYTPKPGEHICGMDPYDADNKEPHVQFFKHTHDI